MDKIQETPVSIRNLQPGQAVVVADYSQFPTRYHYGQVTAISEKDQIITIGGLFRYSSDGWVYTSNDSKRYSQRLLQETPQLTAVLKRESYIRYLFGIDWSVQTDATLNMVYQTFVASLHLLSKEGE